MSNYSMFTQIGMILIAITITLTYLKPTFANIESTRVATDTYISESEKVKGLMIF